MYVPTGASAEVGGEGFLPQETVEETLKRTLEWQEILRGDNRHLFEVLKSMDSD